MTGGARAFNTPLTRRTMVALAGVGALGATLAACGSQDTKAEGPLPTEGKRLDADQADALAVARFGVYRRQRAAVTFTLPGGVPDRGQADVDFVNHLAFGTSGEAHDPLAWTLTKLAVAQGDPTQASSWSGRPLGPQNGAFDILLSLILQLGQDRPENPQLLQQSDAQYLGERELFGQRCQVYKGPSRAAAATAEASPSGSPTAQGGSSRIRYWLASDNALVRCEVFLGDPEGRMAVVDLDPGKPVPELPDYAYALLGVQRSGSASPSAPASSS